MEKFRLAADSFDQDEIDAVTAVMKSGRYTMGEQVQLFERELAEWLGVKHCLMVNSGSSANLLMVESLLRRSLREGSLKPGDEVLVPALAWPTTVWPVLQLGLTPVYTDVDPQTLAIDVASAERSLSPRTKAMCLIHVLGLSADMNAIGRFCERHGLILIEDCCESFGSFFEGRHVGRFGACGSLSHFFSHHLTTMEGGTVLTDDSELYDDLKSFRAHGWIRDRADREDWIRRYPDLDPRFFFVTTGYNVRPMELQAAVGRVQLKKIDGFLARRDQLAALVEEARQQNAPALRLIGSEFMSAGSSRETRRHSWMNFPFQIDKSTGLTRQKVMQTLEEHGVETRPIIAGNLSKHPANEKIQTITRDQLEICDGILDRGFMIGCHHQFSEAHIETLVKAFKAVGRL